MFSVCFVPFCAFLCVFLCMYLYVGRKIKNDKKKLIDTEIKEPVLIKIEISMRKLICGQQGKLICLP